jgi:phenylalanyl-tRNA synthetase beta chain
VRASLTALGFSFEPSTEDVYRVAVPYWRTDVRIADDVIEEIIRIVGYDALPSTQILGSLPEFRPEPLYELRGRVQDLLAALGMQEVITYSLVSEKLTALVPDHDAAMPALKIVNPASQEHVVLRRSLRPSLLQTLATNLRHRRGLIALFESARVYTPRADDLPEESEVVTGVVAGHRADRWGSPTDENVDFYDLKGIVEELLRGLRVPHRFRAAVSAGLVPGRTAEILSGEAVLGAVGQVDVELARRFDIDQDVFLFEFPLADLLPLLGTTPGYKPHSRFPAVEQDLAIIVDESIEAEAVEGIVRRGRFVVDVQPFDLYVGPPIPSGRKSLALSVKYQADDHTLTDEEVTRSRARVVQQLERTLGAQLRDG